MGEVNQEESEQNDIDGTKKIELIPLVRRWDL